MKTISLDLSHYAETKTTYLQRNKNEAILMQMDCRILKIAKVAKLRVAGCGLRFSFAAILPMDVDNKVFVCIVITHIHFV